MVGRLHQQFHAGPNHLRRQVGHRFEHQRGREGVLFRLRAEDAGDGHQGAAEEVIRICDRLLGAREGRKREQRGPKGQG